MQTTIIAVLIASGMAWMAARFRSGAVIRNLTAATIRQEAEIVAHRQRIAEWEVAHSAAQANAAALRSELSDRGNALASSQATLEAARTQQQENQALLLTAREEMTNQFRVLASDLLEEKSTKFVALNQMSLTQLLAPLQGELTGFRQKIDEVYLNESIERGVFKDQLTRITALHDTLLDGTKNLTMALKGDSKVQGDWGEMILDRLLESVGFVEGTHYTRQGARDDHEGNRLIPDIVLELPGTRQMVVDSKVTLTAYAELVEATDEPTRAAALKRHIDAVRQHIKGLSDKKYETLYGLDSIDVVAMFMPVEGAFHEAYRADAGLGEYAWKHHVLLVSPSTMLFAVRTIAHLWQQDKQTQNALDIADRGAKMYDKFAGLAEDLVNIGAALDRARESWDSATTKFSTGQGNLVRQAQMLVELGVKARKKLPAAFAEAAKSGAEDEDAEVAGLLN